MKRLGDEVIHALPALFSNKLGPLAAAMVGAMAPLDVRRPSLAMPRVRLPLLAVGVQ